MCNVAMLASCLLVLASSVGAQQDGKSAESSKPGASETCEIRAYVLNKERETINVIDLTAMLVVEGKDGTDLRIPLQVITTKTGEKGALQTTREPRELEGTPYFVSLIKVHAEGSRRSEADDADRRLTKESKQEANGKPKAAPTDSDKCSFTLEGPYFKADLTREQLAAFTCKVSVLVSIKGSNHAAKGFSCALAKGDGPREAMCKHLADECIQLERHLKANEMDKAGLVADRISASLCAPCAEGACQHARHGCPSCCNDLRAAISAGNRAKALEALDALKSQCSTCVPSKTESKVTGDPK